MRVLGCGGPGLPGRGRQGLPHSAGVPSRTRDPGETPWLGVGGGFSPTDFPEQAKTEGGGGQGTGWRLRRCLPSRQPLAQQVTFHQGDGAKLCRVETALSPRPHKDCQEVLPSDALVGARANSRGSWVRLVGRGWRSSAAQPGGTNTWTLQCSSAGLSRSFQTHWRAHSPPPGQGPAVCRPRKYSGCFLCSPPPRHRGPQEVTHWRDWGTCSARKHLMAGDRGRLHFPEVVSTAAQRPPPRPQAQDSCWAAPGPRGPPGGPSC